MSSPLSVMTRRQRRFKSVHAPNYAALKIRTERNGLGVLKTLCVAGFIVLEAALCVLLFVWFIEIFRWYLLISFCLSLFACVYILSSPRSGQSKAVWILFLLLLFPVGYLICLIPEPRIFFCASKRKLKGIFARTEEGAKGETPSSDARVREDCRYLFRVGHFHAYAGNALKYFPSGAKLFDDVLASLRAAQRYVYIEYFIIEDGILLERLFGVLKERAAAGVDVRVIYDDMGSHGTLRRRTKRRMRAAGIRIVPFNRLVPLLSVAMNYRDHRKIIAIDGRVAYTGGSNLADEYINEKRMYGYWKDTGLRLKGPAAQAFTLMFLRQWEFITGERTEHPAAAPGGNGSTAIALPYADGLDYPEPIGRNMYVNMAAKATERIYIMTPYFVPDDTMFDTLKNKAMAGVDVRMILPGIPDKGYVYKVTLQNAAELQRFGAKIFLMRDSFVHSKVMLTEYSAVVGSINLDMRSFYQQFECAVYTDDRAVMAEIAADFADTFPECEALSVRKNGIKDRFLAVLLRIFAPLM